MLEGRERAILERTVLPQFIRRQRWFGAKSRTLETTSIRDWFVFPTTELPMAILYVRTFDPAGSHEDYQVPVAVVSGPAAESILQNNSASIMAHVKSSSGDGLLCDALLSDVLCTRLVEMIEKSESVQYRSNRLVGIPTSALAAASEGEPAKPFSARRGASESSNSHVVLADRYWLKIDRLLTDGPSVDFEVGRFLTEEAKFPRVPKTLGTLEFRRSKMGPTAVGVLREFVANQGQAWELAQEVLSRYFEDVSGEGHRLEKMSVDPAAAFEMSDGEVPHDVAEVLGSALRTATILGQRTAEMHLALASVPTNPDFAPEPLTVEELAAIGRRIAPEVRQSLATLKARVRSLPEDLRPLAAEVIAAGPRLQELVGRTPAAGAGLVKIRCHGDYHLGQLLWHEGDFIILDFEGEPGRPIGERRAKYSPLKDVAGMLRSFDYAAYSALDRVAKVHPDALERLEPWARIWQAWTSSEFLKAYRRVAASLLPEDPASARQLLDLFRLEKALFELQYELDYRPDWVRIPILGILNLTRSRE